MDTINSKSNEKVKFVKSLNEKKFRQRHNCFYIEGIKVVNEILDQIEAIDIKFIAFCEEILTKLNGGEKLLERLNMTKKVSLFKFDKTTFEYMSDTISTQGVLIVLKIPNYNLDDVIHVASTKNENILILDKVQDAGNIGTIIRSATAFDISTIFCVSGTTDIYSPKVTRSTMGTILKSNIVYIVQSDIAMLIYKLKQKKYNIVGTSLNTQVYLSDFKFSKKNVFVVGNEANGISDNMLSLCDSVIKIPIEDGIESLNVGIATGIILYESYNYKLKLKD